MFSSSFQSPLFSPLRKLSRLSVVVALVALTTAWARPAQAQFDDEPGMGPQTDSSLVAETSSIQPGKPFTVALRLVLEKDWHVYWRNPGDSGLPTRINWTLPAGFKAGAIQWPSPKLFSSPPLVGYGYADEVWLLTQITPPATLPVGKPVVLTANASWLVCSEQCVPQEKELYLQLNVAKDAPAPVETRKAQFAAARARLPIMTAQSGLTVRADQVVPKAKNEAALNLRFAASNPKALTADQLKQVYFYPADTATLTHPTAQKLVKDAQGYRIPLQVAEGNTAPKRLRGVLCAPGATASSSLARGVWIDVPVNAPAK